jgi:hypothetical protein
MPDILLCVFKYFPARSFRGQWYPVSCAQFDLVAAFFSGRKSEDRKFPKPQHCNITGILQPGDLFLLPHSPAMLQRQLFLHSKILGVA